MLHFGEQIDSSHLQQSLQDMGRVLAKQANALDENRLVLRVLDELARQPSVEEAIAKLVSLVGTMFQTQCTALVASVPSVAGLRVLSQSGKLGISDADFDVVPGYLGQSRRLVDATVLGSGITQLGVRSAMIVPLPVPGKETLSLLCLAEAEMAFGHGEFRRLQAIAKVAAQPLSNLLLEERNRKLSALILGKDPLAKDASEPLVADLPFQAVSHAMGRLTHAQEMMVDVLNDILSTRGNDIEHRLADSLSRICAHTDADRAVIGLTGPLGVIQQEISWSAQEFSAQPDMQRAYWTKIVPSVMILLSMGQPAIMTRQNGDPKCLLNTTGYFESIALLPIMDDGNLIGVLGIDHLKSPYFFVPGMVYLLQSVAFAIASVYRQRRIEKKSAEAQSSLWLERRRLQATLSALPDLVIEVDESGRFVTHHSRQNPLMNAIMERLLGRTFEDALPDHLAALGRYMLEEVALSGRSECAPFQYEVEDGDVRWIKAAAVRRDGGSIKSGDPTVTLFVLRDVTTEITQAEDISRLSQVARRTHNLVLMTDAEFRITWVNEAFERATGWRLSEVIGRVPSDFLIPKDTNRPALQSILRDLNRGLPVRQETLNVTRDGREFWVSNDIQPIFDAGGVITGYVGVQLDITERRAHEEAIAKAAAEARESRGMLLAAIEALQDGFVIFDRDGRLLMCNQKYRDHFPLTSDLLVPGTTRDEIFEAALARGSVLLPKGMSKQELKFQMMGVEGEERAHEYQLASGRWMRAYNRQTPDGSWVGLRVDITALKLAEAGAVSDRKVAMNAAKDGMAIVTNLGAVRFANPAFVDMFDLHGEAPLEGKQLTDLLGPAFASSLAARGLPENKASGKDWHDVITVKSGEKETRQIEVSITSSQDGTAVWVLRDLSEHLRHIEERRILMEELQLAQRREVIGQLAAGLAHDFNNLLAAISGSAMLIKEDHPRHSADWGHAERILKSTSQAEAMVRRLLALGARPAHHQKISLAPLIREAAEMLRPALSRAIQLKIETPEAPILADVESTDILQIILNLGVNARDALLVRKANALPPEIRLELREAMDEDFARTAIVQKGSLNSELSYACLVVADNGDGISEDFAEEIFNSYFTTKGKKGTGLGLSIVTNMVRAAGGAISLRRSAEGGAEFRVFLPLSSASPAYSGATQVSGEAATVLLTSAETAGAEPSGTGESGAGQIIGKTPLKGRSILVVDDMEDVLDVMTAILERAGAEVAPTSDPEAAIEVLSEDPMAFDLVITDFDMGGISGADLTRSLKEFRPDLPVILITALTDWKSRDQAKANAPDPAFYKVLGKPVGKELLVGTAVAAIDSTKD